MESNNITVAVSYFYNGKGWTDKYTGIEFFKKDAGYPIQIPKSKNLEGIKRSLRLNTLYLIDGDLDTSGENTIDKLDPSELNEDQLKEFVGGSSSGNEAKDKEIASLKADKTKLETDNKGLSTDKTKLEADNKTLTGEKTKMYLIHLFTEAELSDAYFTAIVLKDILTIKGIAFDDKDAKPVLQTKLLEGQAK